jgi:hypothetical protein
MARRKKVKVDTSVNMEELTTDEMDLGFCPYCKSSEIEWEGPDPVDDMIVYSGYCFDCENSFQEWYDIHFNCILGYPVIKQKKGKK